MAQLLKVGRNAVGQSMLVPKPALTESNLPDQAGKVFIVTGANTGIGKDLAGILYSKNGTVYAAGRNVEKTGAAIAEIQKAHSNSSGKIEFLKLDLADLASIKASAEEFLAKEKQLHVLFNNAGVMLPPRGSKTTQGYELQMGTNCLGPYLFSTFLKSILEHTASISPPNTVRVAWAGSLAIDASSPNGGVRIDEKGGARVENNTARDYGASKAGNLFLAQQFAEEIKDKSIVSVVSNLASISKIFSADDIYLKCFNPGNLRTDLQRHVTGAGVRKIVSAPFKYAFLYPSVYGAYTELYCGLSPDLTTADNGSYVAPWGRKSFNRSDVEASMKGETEGGTGVSVKFAEYVKREIKSYL